MSGETRYLIAYDIVEDKRRNRVANILKDFGARLQKSVFECRARPETLEDIRRKLVAEIDGKTDSVLIVPLCRACAGRRIALGVSPCFEEEEEAFRVL